MQELHCRQKTKEAVQCVNLPPVLAMRLVYELELNFVTGTLKVKNYLG